MMPITDSLVDGWFPINPEAVVPVTEAGGVAEVVDVGRFSPLLGSTSFEDLSVALERTEPDPIADANRALDVDERFAVVQEQWFANDEPGQGELTDAELAEGEK